MQEIKPYTVLWKVISDLPEFTITEEQLDKLMRAEVSGARVVRFEDQVLNIAYFKGAYKIRQEKPKAVWDDSLGKPVSIE